MLNATSSKEEKKALLKKSTGDYVGMGVDRCASGKVKGTGVEIHAHGDITFRGITRVTKAKFIRIPDSASAVEAWRLMQDKWKLSPPSLIISVTGAATDFSMSEKLAESFQSTILKACTLPNACIITGGKYGGVTRLVSDALEKSDTGKSLGVSFMGVANWDKIHQKDTIAENRPYVIGSWLTQKSLNLDYKHTHFLLVKDVQRKDTESQLKGNLERYIVKHYKAPAVRVILNGGVNVLNTIYELLVQPDAYPIVIVHKSGRIADVIAYGLKNYQAVMDKKTAGQRHNELWLQAKDVLYEKYGPLFGGDDWDAWFEGCYDRLLYCVERKDMLVLSESGDVDAAVMTALLTNMSTAFDKMKLTLLWDRADYARRNIFKSSMKVKYIDLKYIMLMALSRGNTKYVKLLMDYGVNMHELLNVGILEFLYGYQAMEDGSPLKSYITPEDFKNLEGVGISDADAKSRKSLSRDFIQQKLDSYLCFGLKSDVRIFNVFEGVDGITSESLFLDPFWELFMWALLSNLEELTMFFWPFGNNQMAKALIASEVWKHISHSGDMKEDTRANLTEGSKTFHKLAVKLLEQSYSNHEENTTLIITTTLPNIKRSTVLDVAALTYNYEFIANCSVQSFIDDVWTGRLKTKKLTTKYYAMILLNIIFPFFVPTQIQFPEKKGCGKDEVSYKYEKRSIKESFKKIKTFYFDTPIVTYLLHVIGYFFFVAIYTYYVTMTKVGEYEAHTKESVPLEYVLGLWVCGHFIDEMYHVATYDMESYRKKFSRWFSDGYNKIDVINIAVFIISWVLGVWPVTRPYAHTLHAINCGFWILRVLTVLRIHEELGLYLQMILEMLNDLLWFMFILFFVLLAYAIMSTSLLYPGETTMIGHLQMFMRSWFAIYGEHFMNSEPPDDDYDGTTFIDYGPIHNPKAHRHDNYVVWVIFGLYLLFTNLLLLNIIIAAFNTTYSRVQENANNISKYGKYLVIVEYSRRAVSTPPPFSLIHHLILLCRWAYFRCRRLKRPHSHTKLNRKHEVVDDAEYEQLVEFEYFCARQVYKVNKGGHDDEDQHIHEDCDVEVRFNNVDHKLEKIKGLIGKAIPRDAEDGT